MAEKVMGSYLYELKPYIDKKKWKDASGEIDTAIKSTKMSADEWKSRKKEYAEQIKEISRLKGEIQALEKEAAKLEKSGNTVAANKIKDMLQKFTTGPDGKLTVEGKKADLENLTNKAQENKLYMDAMAGNVDWKSSLAGKMSSFASGVTAATGALSALYNGMKKAITGAIDLVEQQAELSNKLNAFGSFGNMGVRDTMSRFGVSSLRANAMQSVMGYMGISESDFGRMTDAQRKTYDELINYYEQGINKIDPTKLKEYYETMDEFQTNLIKFRMDLKSTILKMFAESESFKKLTGSLERFFEKFIDFLETPIVQWFLDTFLEFLSSLVDIASDIFSIFPGGSKSSTTNTTNNSSTNTYYIYGSDYSSNSELARSIALEQQTGGIG